MFLGRTLPRLCPTKSSRRLISLHQVACLSPPYRTLCYLTHKTPLSLHYTTPHYTTLHYSGAQEVAEAKKKKKESGRSDPQPAGCTAIRKLPCLTLLSQTTNQKRLQRTAPQATTTLHGKADKGTTSGLLHSYSTHGTDVMEDIGVV